MFYGFLISIALIFPYILRYDSLNESFSNWLVFSALFMAACLVFGILFIDSRRIPNECPWRPDFLLYPMPFSWNWVTWD